MRLRHPHFLSESGTAHGRRCAEYHVAQCRPRLFCNGHNYYHPHGRIFRSGDVFLYGASYERNLQVTVSGTSGPQTTVVTIQTAGSTAELRRGAPSVPEKSPLLPAAAFWAPGLLSNDDDEIDEAIIMEE
jgi:hypothetical protein